MSNSGLLRTAIGSFGLFVVTMPVTLAAPPADAGTEPTVTTLTLAASPSESFDAQSCRYKHLPGSHIKIHVCTANDGTEYRMDRRARTNAVVIPGGTAQGAVVVPAPLPQVQ